MLLAASLVVPTTGPTVAILGGFALIVAQMWRIAVGLEAVELPPPVIVTETHHHRSEPRVIECNHCGSSITITEVLQ